MAEVLVKLFGVFRVDTGIPEIRLRADKVGELFPLLNEKSMEVYAEHKKKDGMLAPPPPFAFKDAIVYVNGERCAKKGGKLTDGDEIWLLSPASGG